MVDITTRTAKGSPLTIGEMDANLTALKAAVEAAVTALAGKADTGHQQAASTISDFLEAVQDAVGAMIVAAGGTYNDTAGTIALPSSGGGAVSSVAGRTGAVVLASADLSDILETVQDAVGAMVAAAGGTYNDAAGTITLPSGGGGAVASVAGRTGAVVLATSDLSDFLEAVQDAIGAMVAAAGGTYNDGAGTITLPTGGGGGQASDATLTALAALTGDGVVTATATDTFAMRAIGTAAASDIPDRAAADARYAAVTELTAPIAQFEVAAGQTLNVTRALHQGATITLAGAGATIAFSATTQGNGFTFTLYNETGAAWTVPTFTGATNRYSKGAAHTQIENAGGASFEVITWGGVRRCRINGDTV